MRTHWPRDGLQPEGGSWLDIETQTLGDRTRLKTGNSLANCSVSDGNPMTGSVSRPRKARATLMDCGAAASTAWLKDRKEAMPENRVTLIVIVGGDEYAVPANKHAPLHTIIPEALKLSKNTGQPPENWDLKDVSGNPLDGNMKIEDLPEDAKVFLSLKAGIGG